ncbi:serine carboxypeptidase-like 15 [Diospyros lotus]|uniref:serine carboxypeptidase-like 15 n=1 Tax=Diospyros lotus TaxID=55363 RepID=UPI0022538F01|nr:serine carboxypeptidase-like 15 [Diospyros lotus]
MFAAEAAARPASRPAAAKPCSSSRRHVHFLEILTAAILLPVAVIAAGQTVEYLPGYAGRLPFHLQTGYISVGDSELFYYFIESQGDPLEDPLILWLTGGPGCSSFSGLVYETGPLEFVIENYTGGLPQLRHYPYAWTKVNIIIIILTSNSFYLHLSDII